MIQPDFQNDTVRDRWPEAGVTDKTPPGGRYKQGGGVNQSKQIVKMKIRESVRSSINDAATSQSKKFLKKAELAAILGVQTRTIETWVRKRKIGSIKAGHRTQLFQLDKVIRDLGRFEIQAIGGGK